MKREPRETVTRLEVVFMRESAELYVHPLKVLSSRSVAVGMQHAVQHFNKQCPGISLIDGVTIQVRSKDAT